MLTQKLERPTLDYWLKNDNGKGRKNYRWFTLMKGIRNCTGKPKFGDLQVQIMKKPYWIYGADVANLLIIYFKK